MPSKMVRFLIFSQKIFVWIHEPPINDLGGRGRSPGVLKQYPQIKPTAAKLLGNLLKEFRAFSGFLGKAEKEGSWPSNLHRFLIFLQKIFVWIHEPPISDLGGRGRSPGDSVLK